MDQAKLVIGEAEARALLDLAWTIDGPGPAAAVAEASVPGAKLRTAALCTLHGRLTNDHGQGSAMTAEHLPPKSLRLGVCERVDIGPHIMSAAVRVGAAAAAPMGLRQARNSSPTGRPALATP